jgi:small-conductance mechanosensitive channel
MQLLQAILYIAAVVLIALAAFGVPARVSLALLGAGCALLAYALPVMAAAI